MPLSRPVMASSTDRATGIRIRNHRFSSIKSAIKPLPKTIVRILTITKHGYPYDIYKNLNSFFYSHLRAIILFDFFCQRIRVIR